MKNVLHRFLSESSEHLIFVFKKINNLPLKTKLFALCAIVFVVGVFTILWKVNQNFLITIPDRGGTLREGVVGFPRFINPVLSFSNTDNDLASLIYSGLMKTTPDGNLTPDLAESYEVSEDGKIYTFTLKKGLVFHDNTPLTTDDIAYTIERIQDSLIKSPRQSRWDSVSTEVIDEYTIRFILQQPFSPFIDGTTVGILPRHIWEHTNHEQFAQSFLNISPIGTGPYKIKEIINRSGLPVSFILESFEEYALGIPYIKQIEFSFYSTEEDLFEAVKRGEIESTHDLSPANYSAIKGKRVIHTTPLSRIFGIFFNQTKQDIFLDKRVRQAVSLAIDRKKVINDALGGYGIATDSPVPPQEVPTDNVSYYDTDHAHNLLLESDWNKNLETGIYEKKSQPLSFTIVTGNNPELISVATALQEDLRTFGIEVIIQSFDQTTLNQNYIRQRDYEALFFGLAIGRGMDLFPFWHSSQRNDPGLNVSLYANNDVDSSTEKARQTTSREERALFIQQTIDKIKEDAPAAFLYTPLFTYAIPEKLNNVMLGNIDTPSERFRGVHTWYIETDKVWKFFKEDNNN